MSAECTAGRRSVLPVREVRVGQRVAVCIDGHPRPPGQPEELFELILCTQHHLRRHAVGKDPRGGWVLGPSRLPSSRGTHGPLAPGSRNRGVGSGSLNWGSPGGTDARNDLHWKWYAVQRPSARTAGPM